MSDLKNLILVIEDEALLLEAIGKKLQKVGYEVLLCTHASQALDYLKTLETLPDLIWLDYYLPDMNGADFMDNLNKNPAWKKIPVIVVSNSASAQKVKTLMDKGVKKHILKADYRMDQIIEIIKNYLPKGGENA